MQPTLYLADGTSYQGKSFGYEGSVNGEVVFSTGMVGYPQSLTDPSYAGQILVNTYPLVGNYGVPDQSEWESGKIQATALVVSDYIDTPSHIHSTMTLGAWLKQQKIPGIIVKDTRELALRIRDFGSPLGKIVFDKDVPFADPNEENLSAKVSTAKPYMVGSGKKTIMLIDCGVKRNIIDNLTRRGMRVVVVPWDYDIFNGVYTFDAILVSNGPGDPKVVTTTVETVRRALKKNIPMLGICLGNQIITLAAGGDTYKLKFGHRGQNQPCILEGTKRCYLTTQNHGFAVGKVPHNFRTWFTNANDGTNEGIIHVEKPVMSVQFHPESTPGPLDTEWIFDYFLAGRTLHK